MTSPDEPTPAGALDSVRVLDFTWAASGPYLTELLSFLGAEVIKVENPERPDVLRYYATQLGWVEEMDLEASGEFNDLNLGKKSITLDLGHPRAQALVKKLVPRCDLVVENFRPGVMERLGIDYDTLKQYNDELVMISISGWGQRGKESEYSSYAPVFAAMGGIMHLTGYEDGRPSPVRLPIDLNSGVFGAVGALAALFHTMQTGDSQYVDCSAIESVTCLIGDSVTRYTLEGLDDRRTGNAHPGMVPHEVFPTADDKWVAVAAGTEDEWTSLCDVLGREDWKTNARWAEDTARLDHREDIHGVLREWCSQRDAEAIVEQLQSSGVPATLSASPRDLMESDHLEDRNFFRRVQHPVLGERTVTGPPWRMSETPLNVERRAPLMGEHNEEVYRELLGLSSTEFEELVDDGAIPSSPRNDP